jgi:hypothetical protein
MKITTGVGVQQFVKAISARRGQTKITVNARGEPSGAIEFGQLYPSIDDNVTIQSIWMFTEHGSLVCEMTNANRGPQVIRANADPAVTEMLGAFLDRITMYTEQVPVKDQFLAWWATLPAVEFNPEWHNGTDYYNGVESMDLGLAPGQMVKSRAPAPNSRRIIIVGTQGGDLAMFERYTPDLDGDLAPFVLVFNAKNCVDRFVSKRKREFEDAKLDFQHTEDVWYGVMGGRLGMRNVGLEFIMPPRRLHR